MASSPNLYDSIIAAIPFLARLQDWVISLGNRKSATLWLSALSFLQATIFPVPVDPLLAGIVLARPKTYIRLAVITALASTLGGILGWWIGVWIGDAVIASGLLGKDSAYDAVAAGFAKHGWVFVLIGAFTPLPYKITTISAGFLGIGFLPFVVASFIGRSARYTLIAAIVRYRRDNKIVGLLTLVLAGIILLFWGVLL
jgi:membrane protein YqaA with SNARE-associated domain